VRLAPEGLLVPAGTLRVLLGRRDGLELLCTGFALEPSIKDGDRVVVRRDREPHAGDLALCEIDRWGDVRRVLRRNGRGDLLTALDACPAGREIIERERVLGVIEGRSPGAAAAHLAAWTFPLWSRLAALRYWWRRIRQAPEFAGDAAASVRHKYSVQVEEYGAMLHFPLGEALARLVSENIPPGGSILVAGSGAGGEALHFARLGYRVTGFDFVPAMLEAAALHARTAGLEVRFIEAEISTLDLDALRFDAVFVTPLVYSFIPGRKRRIESLRRLGRHLKPGGRVIFTAHVPGNPLRHLETALLWMRRRWRRRGGSGDELGDWYTWFLTRQGTIGTSFLHVSRGSQVLAEARRAGFRAIRREGRAYFVASEFAGREANGAGRGNQSRSSRAR
jgi:SAM-dependent methyltransferase